MMSTGKLDKIQLPKHVGDMKSLKNTVSDSFQDICAVGVESFPMINNRIRFDKIHFQISIFKHFFLILRKHSFTLDERPELVKVKGYDDLQQTFFLNQYLPMAPTSLMNLVTKTLSNKDVIHAAYDRMRRESEEKAKVEAAAAAAAAAAATADVVVILKKGETSNFDVDFIETRENKKLKILANSPRPTPKSTPEPSAKKMFLKTISERSGNEV